MRIMTLCILKRNDSLLLGMKKRGFGAGRYNGFGGKVNPGEAVEACAKREVREEAGVTVDSLVKVAELIFNFSHKPDWNCLVHVFLSSDWTGEPLESEEMKPSLFSIKEIPYAQMWPDDKYWLPHVLAGKFVSGRFVFGEGDAILEHSLSFPDKI